MGVFSNAHIRILPGPASWHTSGNKHTDCTLILPPQIVHHNNIINAPPLKMIISSAVPLVAVVAFAVCSSPAHSFSTTPALKIIQRCKTTNHMTTALNLSDFASAMPEKPQQSMKEKLMDSATTFIGEPWYWSLQPDRFVNDWSMHLLHHTVLLFKRDTQRILRQGSPMAWILLLSWRHWEMLGTQVVTRRHWLCAFMSWWLNKEWSTTLMQRLASYHLLSSISKAT